MMSVVPLHQVLVAVIWLAVIVLSILGASRAARFLPQRFRPVARPADDASQSNALVLRGSMPLDLRRRLYLVEAAGRPTLILTGGTADLMLAIEPAEG